MSTPIAAEPKLRRLTREQVALYARDGFLILRNVFSAAEIAELDHDARLLVDRHDLINVRNIRCRWKDHVQTKACTFECFDPVIDLSPACDRFAHDRRILEVVGDLYGEPAHLFKDKLIFKPSGVEGYKLHQDWISWKGFPTSFVTVLVPIDACDQTNGCTVVYPGCHTGYASTFDGEYHETPDSWVAGVTPAPLELQPGDIAIFGAFTPHYSEPNRSGGPRRQLYLSYNAASDGGDQRQRHYEEFHRWLREKYAQYGKSDVYFQ